VCVFIVCFYLENSPLINTTLKIQFYSKPIFYDLFVYLIYFKEVPCGRFGLAQWPQGTKDNIGENL